MDKIDINYIIDGKVQLFDWLFLKKVGIDGDKNFVYLVQDKFRDHRYAKFITLADPSKIKQQITQLLIYQNSSDSKLIQPIHDFTISRDKRIILVTMPVPPRTLFSVIKDTKADLRVRLFLVQNLAGGCLYMHNRRRCVLGHVRPESIVIHEELNAFEKDRNKKRFGNPSEAVELYARLNNFSTLVETQQKPENWKWAQNQLQYYDAPEVWSQSEKKRNSQNIQDTDILGQSQKAIGRKYSEKTDVWALGLIFIEVLSAMTMGEILGQSEPIPPAKLLRQATIRYKIRDGKNQINLQNPYQVGNQPSREMNVKDFYNVALKYIDSMALRSIIEQMLSIKPKNRPTIEQVLRIIEKLEVVDKRNKNISRVYAYNRSLRNLNQCQPPQGKKQDEQQNDDRKSVISLKSVRSGKSSKSHYSQSRKRAPLEFAVLLYARQSISQVHSLSSNSLYRTYAEDCRSRLASDINFVPPASRTLVRKEDKAIVAALRGEEDGDIKLWNVTKAMAGSSETDAKWNGTEERRDMEGQYFYVPYGPVVQKIPSNVGALKEIPYNQNLTNYHYLAIENLKSQKSLQTCLHRVPAPEPQPSQKTPQFILNLKHSGLRAIPTAVPEFHWPSRLKYLNLAHNGISSLRELGAGHLWAGLLVLDVSCNCLGDIDAELWRLEGLQEVYLMGNRIAKIAGLEQEAAGRDTKPMDGEDGRRVCRSLKKLYLNSNKIRQIDNVFCLPSLEVLALGKNPIQESVANIQALQRLRNNEVKVHY